MGIFVDTKFPTKAFSSPFSGTFFQFDIRVVTDEDGETVFVPFLGDFFSMPIKIGFSAVTLLSFRPLSRGLFFNEMTEHDIGKEKEMFSSPFSGTFFQ